MGSPERRTEPSKLDSGPAEGVRITPRGPPEGLRLHLAEKHVSAKPGSGTGGAEQQDSWRRQEDRCTSLLKVYDMWRPIERAGTVSQKACAELF